MLNRIKMMSVGAAAVLIGPGHLLADPLGEPGYATRYYSEATHQTQVGTLAPRCTYNGVTYSMHGTATAYSETELLYYCYEGVAEPV